MSIRRTLLATKGYEFIVYPSDLFKTYTFEKEDIQYEKKTVGRSQDKFFTRVKNIVCNDPRQSLDYSLSPEDKLDCYNRVQDIIERIREEHCRVFQFDYAFILHDQDREADGSLKKFHFHVYCWSNTEDFPDPIYQQLRFAFNHVKVHIELLDYYEWCVPGPHNRYCSVTKEECETKVLLVKDNLSQPIKKLNGALRYMIHIDNDNKAHYDLASAFSNVDLFRHPAFVEATRASQLAFLFDAIDSGRVTNYRELAHCAMKNGCFDAFMKNSWILTNYLRCLDTLSYPEEYLSMPKNMNNLNIQAIAGLDCNLDLKNNLN